MRYSTPELDISSFKRCFHYIVRAERSVWLFCSVKTSPHTSKSQSFVDIVQICALFLSDRDISSFKRSFHCIMRAGRSAWLFCNVETSPHKRKSQSFVDSDNNYALFLSRLSYFDVSPHLTLHAERRARVFHCRNKARHTQIAIIRRFWR